MSRLLLTHETNSIFNDEAPITKRPRRIRPTKRIGEGERHGSGWPKMDTHKRVGKQRRSELVGLRSDRASYVLGRSTMPPEVLSGYAGYCDAGSSDALFTNAHPVGPRKIHTSSTNDTMVIITKPQISKHDALYKTLSHLNCRRTINYLIYTFDGVRDMLVFSGVITTVGDLLNQYPHIADLYAMNVYVKFWGGPPSQQGFFGGTLLTALCDKILQTTTENNTAIYNRFMLLQDNEEEFFSPS